MEGCSGLHHHRGFDVLLYPVDDGQVPRVLFVRHFAHSCNDSFDFIPIFSIVIAIKIRLIDLRRLQFEKR